MTVRAKRDYSILGDGELAALCAGRDPEAVRHVLTTNNQRLFRVAWSILKDRAEAEEALQAAYVSAFSSIGSFEGRSSLTTWLTRIVINEALGRVRKERRRRAQLDAAGVPVLDAYREKLMAGSETPAPDAAVAREQLRRVLERDEIEWVECDSPGPEVAMETLPGPGGSNKPALPQRGVTCVSRRR